ncbi:hypothetical protein V6O07_10140, partial [Arthrospira platensis SPKY2]
MLWLIPLGGGLALLIRWALRRRDLGPWPGLLAWGARSGHPAQVGETEQEYSQRLAGLVAGSEMPAEERRLLVRYLVGLGQSIAAAHYAGGPRRE